MTPSITASFARSLTAWPWACVLNAVCASWVSAASAGANFSLEADWGQDFAAPDTIPVNVIEFTYLFADHCEQIWALLDFGRSGHTLPPDVDPAAPTQPRVAA